MTTFQQIRRTLQSKIELNSFCMNHELLISNACISKNHNNCVILSVSDAVDSIDRDVTLRNISERTDSFLHVLELIIKVKEENIAGLFKKSEEIKKDIKNFKGRIIKELETMEQSAYDSLDKIVREISCDLEAKKRDLQIQRDKITQLYPSIDKFKNNEIDSAGFKKIIEAKELSKKMFDFLENDEDLRKWQSLDFEWSEVIRSLPENIDCLGLPVLKKISVHEVSDALESTTFGLTIELKKKDEKSTIVQKTLVDAVDYSPNPYCFEQKWNFDTLNFGSDVQINRGSFVSKEDLLLKDMKKSTLYLLRIGFGTFQNIELENEPLDLASFDNTRAVVTLKEGGLQVINLQPLSLGPRITKNESFYAVTCMKNKIYARTPYKKLTVTDITGKQIKTIETEFAIDFMCIDEKDRMYCTNYYRNRVFALTVEGEPLYSYSLDTLKGPVGITTDGQGSVYIAGWEFNNIHHIDEYGKLLRIIGSEEDGIYRPMDLSYNLEGSSLMIVNKSCTAITIYTI